MGVVDYTYIALCLDRNSSHYILALRWDGSHSAEVNENINLGYSEDQGYS